MGDYILNLIQLQIRNNILKKSISSFFKFKKKSFTRLFRKNQNYKVEEVMKIIYY